MVPRKQYVLSIRNAVLTVLGTAAVAVLAHAQSPATVSTKVHADAAVWHEAAPRAVGEVRHCAVNDLYDFVDNRFVVPAKYDKTLKEGASPAGDINTMGEVPDSSWYTNRHWLRRMSLSELQ